MLQNKFCFRILTFSLLFFFSKTNAQDQPKVIHYDSEKHLKNVRQLTFDGDNAEAYFSFDNTKITFQAQNEKWGSHCDQIYMADLSSAKMDSVIPERISTGMGRTTCSYFLPGNKEILYASTHIADKDCPPVPPHRADHKYIWPTYDSFDVFVADLHGKIIKQLTDNPGYDAEATVSPKGDKIVFTSMRSGDLELYTMNLDGSDVKQITHELGYDGGAFFSPDGKKLVFRASRPKSDSEIVVYKELLKQNLVMPTDMEIFTCNVDGSDLKQLTHLGGANWAPFYSHDGKKIIFSSNHVTKGFHFNLYMINNDGTGLEQITFDPVFDAFPMFSFDGKKIIWSSNRKNDSAHHINLFIADWVE